MKTREIDMIEVEVEGGEKMIYRDWLKNVLSRPANGQSMQLDEQRKILPLMDLIDPQGVDIKPKKVHLTEEQHELVCERIAAFPYPGFNRLFINFEEDIKAAIEIEMEPKEETA